MPIPELLQASTKWLLWSGLAFTLITLISFLVRWKQSFRLVGISSFTLLLAASCWAFSASYNPKEIIEGAIYVPVVFDNGDDLVVAQAPIDFPEEAITPTLKQLTENLQGRNRNGGIVHIRLRKLQPNGQGISKPIILGEITQNLSTMKSKNNPINKSEDQALQEKSITGTSEIEVFETPLPSKTSRREDLGKFSTLDLPPLTQNSDESSTLDLSPLTQNSDESSTLDLPPLTQNSDESSTLDISPLTQGLNDI